MATSLLIHERIQTTDEKAKELRKYVERMITIAKKARRAGGDDKDKAAKALHYKRLALKYIRLPRIDAADADDRASRKALLDKLFEELAERFENRPGGYTRILKVGKRRGDAASISMIEWVEAMEEADDTTGKKKSKKKKKATPKKAKPVVKAEKTEAAPVEEEPATETETDEPALAPETESEPEPEPEAAEEKAEEETEGGEEETKE